MATTQATQTKAVRNFNCRAAEFDRIYAFGVLMGWSDKPFDFVVQQYRTTLASR